MLRDKSIAKETDIRLSKKKPRTLKQGQLDDRTISSFHEIQTVFIHRASTFVHLGVLRGTGLRGTKGIEYGELLLVCLVSARHPGKRPVQNWRLSFIVAVNPA